MATQLDPKFKLSEAMLPQDADEAFSMLEDAFKKDDIWTAALSDCDPKEVHDWIMAYLAPRWCLPDITMYKITELSTGKIVAWAALQFPWKEEGHSPDAEAKAMINSHDLPPMIKGMDQEGMIEFFTCLSFAGQYGYDMENDYHRKGTMVHPDFQQRGFGTVLTHHCNAISDKTRGRTFVPARPTSIKMFNQCGFKTVGSHDAHLERWGGSIEKSKTWMAIREAPTS